MGPIQGRYFCQAGARNSVYESVRHMPVVGGKQISTAGTHACDKEQYCDNILPFPD